MTPSAKKKMETLAREHQVGVDSLDATIGEKVPGLVAYHKFIAGFTAGYAARRV